MELAYNPAFQNRPEAFDGVGVDQAIDVRLAVVDRLMGQQSLHAVISTVFVREQQGLAQIDVAPHQSREVREAQPIGLPSLHLAFAFHHANHWRFARATATGSVIIVLVIALARRAADIGFIHFNYAGKQRTVILHGLTDAVSDRPRSLNGQFQIPRKLAAGDALLGIQNQRDSQKPFLHRKPRVKEDRPDGNGKRLPAGVAVVTQLTLERVGVRRAAIPADRGFSPAGFLKMPDARFLRGELAIDLDDVHRRFLSRITLEADFACVNRLSEQSEYFNKFYALFI